MTFRREWLSFQADVADGLRMLRSALDKFFAMIAMMEGTAASELGGFIGYESWRDSNVKIMQGFASVLVDEQSWLQTAAKDLLHSAEQSAGGLHVFKFTL